MLQQEKNVGAYCNTPVQHKKINVGAKNLSPVQSENNLKKSPMAARRRYLERLREVYAQKVFSKLLNEFSGTLTMKNHKGTWHLVFSCGQEVIRVQGKTLGHALINLTSESHGRL